MKRNIVLIFTISMLIFSCSKDKNNDSVETGANAIVGTWAATELQIDDATASDDAKLSKLVLDFLTERDCVIITFMFNEDLTLVADNSANFVDASTIISGAIACPTQKETTNSTYTYDGVTLTTVDGDGMIVTIKVTINGGVMTVDATDLNIPDFNGGGNLIFLRQ